jgi:hypothetical protein
MFHGHHDVTASMMLTPRAEADRKRTPGGRRGPEGLVVQRLSIRVMIVVNVANEVEICRP